MQGQEIRIKKYISQFTMMGTLISITLFEKKDFAINEVFDYLQKCDAIYSANRIDSELMKINQAAGISAVKVSAALFELIKKALFFSKENKTSFNILMGPVVKLWKIGFGGNEVPPYKSILDKLKLINPNDIVLDSSNKSVFLKKKDMELDLGAIAKGYFADEIAVILMKYGLKNGIINLGGNVLAFGSNPLENTGEWQFGIRNPFKDSEYITCQIKIGATSLVTSGVNERYFEINNQKYHHILNPKNGYPVNNDLLQVTVLTKSSLLGEVLSTVAFFKGSLEGLKFINNRTDAEAIFITKEKNILVTDGLKNNIKYLNKG